MGDALTPIVRLFLIFPLLASVAVAADDESPPPVDPKVILRVSLDTSRREFHIGEIIPLKLFFSSGAKNRYRLNEASYDRSGRMNYEHFQVVPASGAVDPIPSEAFNIMGGGITNFRFLKPKPWSMRLNLNEWVRFDAPGEYKLTTSSSRVEARDPTGPYVTKTITARSNEITLKILPADRDWQKRTFEQAAATINAHTPNPNEIRIDSDPPTPVEIAWDTLRYLGTPEAARELAKRLREGGFNNEEFSCYMGLVSSPERAAARDALKEALADPDHPIDGTFLSALRIVESEQHPGHRFDEKEQRDRQKKVIEELFAVLPNKRGPALAASLSTALTEAWNVKTLPQQTVDKLVSQLKGHFDQLPPHAQSILLSERWEKIASPALLPIVRQYAQASFEFMAARGANSWEQAEIIGSSIRRWYELDPDGARPFIIREITRPLPRFGWVLGILPDKALPEVEGELAKNLAASKDYQASRNIAALILRYATPAILPQILREADARVGDWECDVQAPILAYVLRVDPEAARPRVKKALAARGPRTGCYRRLLEDVARFYYHPVLEEIGIHALNDRNPEVAASAATMIGKFGSAAAESALRQRYAEWNKHWAGKESKLNAVSDDDAGSPLDDRYLGHPLMEALATGRSWLMDKPKLRDLAGMNRVRTILTKLDEYQKRWKSLPLNIYVSVSAGLSGSLAQYSFDSIDALEEKLAQFPSDTEFVLNTPEDSEGGAQCHARLLAFLASHGMTIRKDERTHSSFY